MNARFRHTINRAIQLLNDDRCIWQDTPGKGYPPVEMAKELAKMLADYDAERATIEREAAEYVARPRTEETEA